MTTATTTENTQGEAIAAPVGGLSLRKNFSWTFVGNVVYAACQWGILVVLAKLGTPEMVGQFALGLAITAPVIMFSQLQLRAVQATDAKREYQFGDYLALRLITTALALAVIGGIVAAGGYRRETALVILIVGAMKGIDALSDVYYGLWQQHERMDGIAQALMLNGVVSAAALAALMVATHNIVIAVLGSAAGSLAAYLFTLAKNKRLALAKGQAAKPHWTPRPLQRLALLAAPLGIVMLLLNLNTNMPRYYIQHYYGEAPLGIFAAIAYLTVAGATVVSALGQSASPRLARHFAEGQTTHFTRLTARLMLIGFALGIAGVLIATFAGRPILNLIYSAEYAEYVRVFQWTTAAATVLWVASFLGYGLTAARQFTIQAPLFAGVGCVSAVSGWLLIPRFGLVGAAWTIGIAAVAQLGGIAVAMRVAMKRRQTL